MTLDEIIEGDTLWAWRLQIPIWRGLWIAVEFRRVVPHKPSFWRRLRARLADLVGMLLIVPLAIAVVLVVDALMGVW